MGEMPLEGFERKLRLFCIWDSFIPPPSHCSLHGPSSHHTWSSTHFPVFIQILCRKGWGWAIQQTCKLVSAHDTYAWVLL